MQNNCKIKIISFFYLEKKIKTFSFVAENIT